VIPIRHEDVSRHDWPELEGAVWQVEQASAFAVHDAQPSDKVVSRIIDDIGADTQARSTRRAATAAIAIVFLAAIVNFFMLAAAGRAQSQRAAAEQRRDLAITQTRQQEALAARAEQQRRNAVAQQKEAEDAKGAAERLARRQRAIAGATSLANTAETLLRQETGQLRRAALLAADSMRQFSDLGMHSVAADLAMRNALEQMARVERRVPLATKGGQYALTKSGRYLAACDGRRVELLDLKTGARKFLPLTDARHVEPIAVHFSDDETAVIAGASSRTTERTWVGVWRVADGQSPAKPIARNEWIYALALSADAHHYATWAATGIVRVWHSATHAPASGALQHEQLGWEQPVALRFSPSGRYLAASGDFSGRLWEWRIAPSDVEARAIAIGDRFAFSEDETTLVTADRGVTKAYSLPDRNERWSVADTGASTFEEMYVVDLVIDGKRAAVARERRVDIHDVDTGRILGSVPVVQPRSIAPHQSLLGVVSGDGTARLYDIPSKRELARVAHPTVPLLMAVNGGVHMEMRNEAASSADATISIDGVPVETQRVSSFVTGTEAAQVVSASWNEVLLWRGETGAATRAMSSDGDTSKFAPDSGLLATLDSRLDDFTVTITNPERDRVLASARTAAHAARGFDYGARGVVAVGADDGRLFVWDGHRNHALEAVALGLRGRVDHVAISRSGRYVAASAGSAVAIADSHGKTLARIEHGSGVWSLAFAQSDEELVTSSADARLRWWRWREPTARPRVNVHAPAAVAMARTDDGRIVTSDHGDVVVWNDRGRAVERITHGDTVTDIVTANGGLLATAAYDGMVRVWKRPPGQTAEAVSAIRANANGRFSMVLSMSRDGRYLITDKNDSVELHLLSHRDLLACACAELAPTAEGDPHYARVCRGVKAKRKPLTSYPGFYYVEGMP
jgi:WD40 repeat protein